MLHALVTCMLQKESKVEWVQKSALNSRLTAMAIQDSGLYNNNFCWSIFVGRPVAGLHRLFCCSVPISTYFIILAANFIQESKLVCIRSCIVHLSVVHYNSDWIEGASVMPKCSNDVVTASVHARHRNMFRLSCVRVSLSWALNQISVHIGQGDRETAKKTLSKLYLHNALVLLHIVFVHAIECNMRAIIFYIECRSSRTHMHSCLMLFRIIQSSICLLGITRWSWRTSSRRLYLVPYLVIFLLLLK